MGCVVGDVSGAAVGGVTSGGVGASGVSGVGIPGAGGGVGWTAMGGVATPPSSFLFSKLHPDREEATEEITKTDKMKIFSMRIPPERWLVAPRPFGSKKK